MTRDVKLIICRLLLLWTCLILSQLGPKVITDETYTYTWVQMLLQIGPSLRLGSKCYNRGDLYYAWAQMLLHMVPLLHLGPVIRLVSSTTDYCKVRIEVLNLFPGENSAQ